MAWCLTSRQEDGEPLASMDLAPAVVTAWFCLLTLCISMAWASRQALTHSHGIAAIRGAGLVAHQRAILGLLWVTNLNFDLPTLP